MLKLSIFNQRLSYFSDSEVVADSKGYLVFTLETSEDWANYVGKTVQFTRNSVTYSVTNISDGVEYAVPWEVLKGAGIMYVNAFAVQSTGKRATTNQIEVEIIESGLNEDSLAPTDPTPDIFQQYVEAVQENADKAAASAKEAEAAASETLNYRNQVQQIKQEVEVTKNDIESLNNQVQAAAERAFNYADAAEQSASAASDSEIKAAQHESEAKIAAQEAKSSETNAKTSETNAAESAETATLEADRAEANQIIVTETKAEIDEIYEDIQARQADITEKNDNINEKNENVNNKYTQIEEWYNNYVQGVQYVEFTDEIITDTTDDDGNTDSEGYWTYNEDEAYYYAQLSYSEKALLNIQILNSTTNQYFITDFVDAVYIDNTLIEIRAVKPFTGRLCLHALTSVVESESA